MRGGSGFYGDWRALALVDPTLRPRARRLLRELPERAGLVAVPTVVFYTPAHAPLGQHLVRFAFCKSDAVLGEAVERLRRLG